MTGLLITCCTYYANTKSRAIKNTIRAVTEIIVLKTITYLRYGNESKLYEQSESVNVKSKIIKCCGNEKSEQYALSHSDASSMEKHGYKAAWTMRCNKICGDQSIENDALIVCTS